MLKFELTYSVVTAEYVSHYATGTHVMYYVQFRCYYKRALELHLKQQELLCGVILTLLNDVE